MYYRKYTVYILYVFVVYRISMQHNGFFYYSDWTCESVISFAIVGLILLTLNNIEDWQLFRPHAADGTHLADNEFGWVYSVQYLEVLVV